MKVRLERLWKLTANFGNETDGAHHFPFKIGLLLMLLRFLASPCYLNEIVSDRYCLVNGVQLLRDELQVIDQLKSGFISIMPSS